MSVLPSREKFAVRAAAETDLDALTAMHDRCSAETLRRRYCLPHPELVPQLPGVLLLSDAVRESLVATDATGAVIGHAQLCILPSGAADVTVLVVDAYQGRGVGSALLARLAEVARRRGIRQLRGRTQPDNWSLYGALARAGLDAEMSYDTEQVTLTAPIPSRPRPMSLRRTA
jgi:GNAT superfamily N-acetyltransferase